VKSQTLISQAIEAFKDHELILNTQDRWRIASRNSNGSICGFYAAEIISLWGGRLYVGGDIDDCIFAYFSTNNPENFHLDKLRWIGKHNDVDYYVKQKASIGLTATELTETWDVDTAVKELDLIIEKLQKDPEERVQVDDIISVKNTARGWGRHEALEEIQEFNLENLIPINFGMVTSPRVIFAWAAVRRLCELLEL
jgi:hypothetical protein